MFTKITKILAAATIAAAGATTISAIHDKKAFDAIEDIAPIGEIGDVVILGNSEDRLFYFVCRSAVGFIG